ncbi:MAG: ribose import ATP-binding protein RbsA [Chloroflexota bacterium]|nr:MAG: ribose import ATP-binding protein RbsA [Chloroflexota bacterium]
MTDQPIIRLENITKRFPGVVALENVSLDIYTGEIHAIIGENGAGKSTLMNILAGDLQPDGGQIRFKGKTQVIPNPYVSQQLGISVVYQELALCPNLSVAENISLSLAGGRFMLQPLNRRAMLENARRVLERLGMTEINLNQPAGQLSVAKQQLVEIAKAISVRLEVLILDEPNSALTDDETQHLFEVLRQLRAQGVAIIYISHRLEEVLQLADRITVLRDGLYIDTLNAAEATVDALISKMVGREIDRLYERKADHVVQDEAVLEIRGLTSGSALRDVSLEVRRGEIVGIAGLPGAGKDELVECAFGLRGYEHGEIRVRGGSARLASPAAAIERGMAFIPADRRGAGALLQMNVQNNIVAASLKALNRLGFLQTGAMSDMSRRYVRELDIRVSGLGQQMATLSGGNQQKVILAKGLATNPTVLILHEPTRGIDVGAKAEIYSILQGLAREGVGILIASSELPELIGQCDRILVMHEGRITGHFRRDEAAEEPILACAMGQAEHLINHGERGA